MDLNNFILPDQIKIKIQLQLANLKHNNMNGLKNKSSKNRQTRQILDKRKWDNYTSNRKKNNRL